MMKLFNLLLKKRYLLFVLMIGFAAAANAQMIKGKVTDDVTKESLIGATVQLKETGKTQVVQLDGYFTFKDIKPGDYTLEFRFVSYEIKHLKVTVSANKVTFLDVTMDGNWKELNAVNITVNYV
jgi:hypothetical protein